MIASFLSLLSIDIQKCEQFDENSNSKTNLIQTVLSYVEKHTAKTQSGWTFHKIHVIRQYFALVHS